MNIHARHGEIVNIVREQTLHSQDELLAILRKRGFKVTQPTLSRDIRELGLAKTPAGYVIPGDLATMTPIVSLKRVDQLLRDSVIFAKAAGNLVVLKTAPGHANSVAVALDTEGWPEVVGTIAGDDTICVITPDNPTAEAVQEKLLGLLEQS